MVGNDSDGVSVIGNVIVIDTYVSCECGIGKKMIVIDCCDVYTVCPYCGFREWEWRCGDSLDYLDYMDKMYRVSERFGKGLGYFVEASVELCKTKHKRYSKVDVYE